MALEIERKFLVRDDSWHSQVIRSVRIHQGYLNQAKDCSVRVRSASERGWLNIKSVTVGTLRHEYEYEIPYQDAEEMLIVAKPLLN